jgi:hypothetical protein
MALSAAADSFGGMRTPATPTNVADVVHQQAVNAVDFLSGPPHREHLVKLVERAILAEVKRLETLPNGGVAKAPLRRWNVLAREGRGQRFLAGVSVQGDRARSPFCVWESCAELGRHI